MCSRAAPSNGSVEASRRYIELQSGRVIASVRLETVPLRTGRALTLGIAGDLTQKCKTQHDDTKSSSGLRLSVCCVDLVLVASASQRAGPGACERGLHAHPLDSPFERFANLLGSRRAANGR